MKTKTVLISLLAALAQIVSAETAAAQSVKSLTLAWNYNPGDSLTNYYFNIRTSQNPGAPLPWPLLISVTNSLTANVTVSLAPNTYSFFYVTANDLRASSTNYVTESDPSNVVSARNLPSGANLTIGKGP